MTTALEGGEWSASRPGRTLPPGKTRYPLCRRLGEPQGRSGRAENLNAYKRAAKGEIAANGFRSTGLFPCDKNIFRPRDFPLSSGDKVAAPVNHPDLVNISNQPSFGSVYFSPFSSTEALLSSDISPVPSLNLKLNPRGGTAKKITSSPYTKFVDATHKKKMKQATKSKTSRPASNVLLGPSKRRKRRVCRDPTPSDTPSDSDTDLCSCSFR